MRKKNIRLKPSQEDYCNYPYLNWLVMTLGHITLLLQFLCNFSLAQVILHELEATKGLILYAGASGKSFYDMKHRSTICEQFCGILSRKIS
jgi:hypothetical protein